MYRPNEAKVKNLKTKDYLGKAKLVAASDRSNAFTGFQGSEFKKQSADVKDDRPPEKISFAATNLVKTDLPSRSRQQSEPPLNRNMFPPTPPPENDRTGAFNNAPAGGMTGRAASVRNPAMRPMQRTMTNPVDDMPGARPLQRMMTTPVDEMDRSTNNSRSSDQDMMMQSGSSQMGPPRMGTMRTASEPRGPPSRQYARRDQQQGQGRQLYREVTPSQRGGYENEQMYDEVYDMYSSPRSSRAPRRNPPRMQQQQYLDEADEYGSDVYEDDSVEEGEFEMVGGNQVPPPLRTRPASNSTRSGGQPRRTEVRKIRVKVHAESDTRYIMIGPAVEYGDFEGRIREKFGIRTRLRIKMQDDGDMITMGDQDDLDMLISTAKAAAKKQREEMAKIEVSCNLFSNIVDKHVAIGVLFRKANY